MQEGMVVLRNKQFPSIKTKQIPKLDNRNLYPSIKDKPCHKLYLNFSYNRIKQLYNNKYHSFKDSLNFY